MLILIMVAVGFSVLATFFMKAIEPAQKQLKKLETDFGNEAMRGVASLPLKWKIVVVMWPSIITLIVTAVCELLPSFSPSEGWLAVLTVLYLVAQTKVLVLFSRSSG